LQLGTATNKSRFTVLTGMIVAAAAFRIQPHPPNFSPIAALALFGRKAMGSRLNNRQMEKCVERARS